MTFDVENLFSRKKNLAIIGFVRDCSWICITFKFSNNNLIGFSFHDSYCKKVTDKILFIFKILYIYPSKYISVRVMSNIDFKAEQEVWRGLEADRAQTMSSKRAWWVDKYHACVSLLFKRQKTDRSRHYLIADGRHIRSSVNFSQNIWLTLTHCGQVFLKQIMANLHSNVTQRLFAMAKITTRPVI